CRKFNGISLCGTWPSSHIASFTSLLRPGTFFTCVAFARMSAKRLSRTCQTGFQYTPVASIATCVHPALSSHSASANNSCVVVGKPRTCRSTFCFCTSVNVAEHDLLCLPSLIICRYYDALY